MSEPHAISAPSRLRVMRQTGIMTVYRRLGNKKPYVVGHERLGRLVLLEEFETMKDAWEWAEANKGG